MTLFIRDLLGGISEIGPRSLYGSSTSYLLDTYSAAAAYSTRQLKTGATNCLRLRRSSDNAESDFGFSAGWLDTASIATWLGVNTGYITTWYDQSGNSKNATRSTAAGQPLYVASGQNSKPVLSFNTGLSLIRSDTPTQPYTIFLVGRRTGSSQYYMDGSGTSNRAIIGDAGNAGLGLYAGVWLRKSWSDQNLYCIIYALFNGASSAVAVSLSGPATALTGDTGSHNPAGGVIAAAFDSISPSLVGTISEIVISDSDLSANRAAIESDINAAWSIY